MTPSAPIAQPAPSISLGGQFDAEILGWQDYQKNREQDALPDQIAAWRANPAGVSPRLLAWAELVDLVKEIDDPRTKVEMVNGWVNAVIVYNYDKLGILNKEGCAEVGTGGFVRWQTPSSYRYNNWFQTPLDTLVNGKGVCCDEAILKYETLKLCGFPLDDMELVSGVDTRFDSSHKRLNGQHMVLFTRIGNEVFVLNNQSRPDKSHGGPGSMRRKIWGLFGYRDFDFSLESFKTNATLATCLPIGLQSASLGMRGYDKNYFRPTLVYLETAIRPSSDANETMTKLPDGPQVKVNAAEQKAMTAEEQQLRDDFHHLAEECAGGANAAFEKLLRETLALRADRHGAPMALKPPLPPVAKIAADAAPGP